MAKNQNSPGPKDVARWLSGEMTDPREVRRLQAAIARDPELQKTLEVLGPELPEDTAGSDEDDHLREMIRGTCSAITTSRAWGMKVDRPSIQQFWAGQPLLGRVAGAIANGRQLEFEIRLQPRSGSANEYGAEFAGLPRGVTPRNITVADLGLNLDPRPANMEATLEPDWPAAKLAAWNAAKAQRTPRSLRLGIPIGFISCGNPVEVQHLSQRTTFTGTPTGNLAAACKTTTRAARQFACKGRPGSHKLDLSCSSDPDRDIEIAVVEAFYRDALPGVNRGVRTCRAAVLERYPGAGLAADFILNGFELELPVDADNPNQVEVTVRAAEERDLHLLSSDDLTKVKGDSELHCFPLMPEARGYWIRILDSDRGALEDPSLTWMLEVNLPEGSHNMEEASHAGI